MSGSITHQSASKEAVFSFIEYRFPEANINFAEFSKGDGISIDFLPSGMYEGDKGDFIVNLEFIAKAEGTDSKLIAVTCIAKFKFNSIIPFEAIPDYFFGNSIAILYPYIRAFVSTLTLQANYPPLILPTLNVSSLGLILKERTNVSQI